MVQRFTSDIGDEHAVKGANKVMSSMGDIRLYECPISYLTRDTTDILQLVSLVRHTGSLLNPGGLAEQPYWLIQTIGIDREEETRAMESK